MKETNLRSQTRTRRSEPHDANTVSWCGDHCTYSQRASLSDVRQGAAMDGFKIMARCLDRVEMRAYRYNGDTSSAPGRLHHGGPPARARGGSGSEDPTDTRSDQSKPILVSVLAATRARATREEAGAEVIVPHQPRQWRECAR